MPTPERIKRYREREKEARQKGPQVLCQCGCGIPIPAINAKGLAATFAHGHNARGQQHPKGLIPWNKGKQGPTSPRKGKRLIEDCGWPADWTEKRTVTRRSHFGGHYTLPERVQEGIAKRPPEWYANVVASIHNRDLNGAANPAWQGGISLLPYGPEFTRKLKRLIRERDGYKCQYCGLSERQERRRIGKVLSIHHIDHDKANNDPTNLVTICNSCNVHFSHRRKESVTAFPSRRMLLS